MSETFTNRNGVTEQVKFYRQQPRHLASMPFDFEEREADFRASRMDKIIFWLSVIGLVAIYAYWYL